MAERYAVPEPYSSAPFDQLLPSKTVGDGRAESDSSLCLLDEQKANLLNSLRGRGPQTRAVDRGEHSRCAQAGTVRWWQKSSGNHERNRGCGTVGGGNHEGN